MLHDGVLAIMLYFAGMALARGKAIGVGFRYFLTAAAPFFFAATVDIGFTAAVLSTITTIAAVWWLERHDAVLYAALIVLCGYGMFGSLSLLIVLGAGLSIWMEQSPYRFNLPSRSSPSYWVFLLYILLGTISWTTK